MQTRFPSFLLNLLLTFKSFVIKKKLAAAAAAKSLQSCPTLCDPIDDSPPGSPIPGILQARILEWVAISFSREENGTQITQIIEHKSWRMNLCKINDKLIKILL